MPIEVLNDAYVSVNGVDLSDHVSSVTFTASVGLQEATVMGDDGVRRLSNGIKDATLEIEFRQDFDASEVDATLWPLLGVETTLAVRKSKTDAKSATNPEYSFKGMMGEYSPIGGAVGDVHNTSVTFQLSDGNAPARSTS